MENPERPGKAGHVSGLCSDLRGCTGLGEYVTAAGPVCKGRLENSKKLSIVSNPYPIFLQKEERETKKCQEYLAQNLPPHISNYTYFPSFCTLSLYMHFPHEALQQVST